MKKLNEVRRDKWPAGAVTEIHDVAIMIQHLLQTSRILWRGCVSLDWSPKILVCDVSTMLQNAICNHILTSFVACLCWVWMFTVMAVCINAFSVLRVFLLSLGWTTWFTIYCATQEGLGQQILDAWPLAFHFWRCCCSESVSLFTAATVSRIARCGCLNVVCNELYVQRDARNDLKNTAASITASFVFSTCWPQGNSQSQRPSALMCHLKQHCNSICCQGLKMDWND